MASIAPLKELISSTALGEMDKILSKDVFPQINIGMWLIKCRINKSILNFILFK